MTNKTKKSKMQYSENMQKMSARLFAAQAVYQSLTNEQNADEVLQDFLDHRVEDPCTEQQLTPPEIPFLNSIVRGVDKDKTQFEAVIDKVLQRENKTYDASRIRNEPLLFSIMLCGAYELIMNTDIDAPLIISDYIEVTRAFYDQGETKLMNGVLDRISKAVRS